MTIPQARVFIQHDVNLDIQLVTCVVCLKALDLLDGFRKAHGEVQEHVALICSGGCACQITDVTGGSAGPVKYDEEGEEKAAEGVEPPEFGVETDCLRY
jgi:hypothetical protein